MYVIPWDIKIYTFQHDEQCSKKYLRILFDNIIDPDKSCVYAINIDNNTDLINVINKGIESIINSINEREKNKDIT